MFARVRHWRQTIQQTTSISGQLCSDVRPDSRRRAFQGAARTGSRRRCGECARVDCQAVRFTCTRSERWPGPMRPQKIGGTLQTKSTAPVSSRLGRKDDRPMCCRRSSQPRHPGDGPRLMVGSLCFALPWPRIGKTDAQSCRRCRLETWERGVPLRTAQGTPQHHASHEDAHIYLRRMLLHALQDSRGRDKVSLDPLHLFSYINLDSPAVLCLRSIGDTSISWPAGTSTAVDLTPPSLSRSRPSFTAPLNCVCLTSSISSRRSLSPLDPLRRNILRSYSQPNWQHELVRRANKARGRSASG